MGASVVFQLLLGLHVLVGLGIIGLVLLQHGKGADMGAAFGSGASGSIFGASGSSNFLSRTTAVLAALFFATSLILTYLAAHDNKQSGSVVERMRTEKPVTSQKANASHGGADSAIEKKTDSTEIPK